MGEHDVMGVTVKDGPREWPEWQHKFVAGKPYPGRGYRNATMTVEAGLHYLKGNPAPYFSVTCSIYEEREDVGGGAAHEEILKLWPELKPVVDLHLSDIYGVPMHPEANGWYWLAGYYGGAGERYHGGNSERQHWKDDGEFDGYRYSAPEECLKVFADHVRISIEEARALAQTWQAGCPYDEAKHGYLAWAKEQRPRWKAEADAAIALLDRLVAARP